MYFEHQQQGDQCRLHAFNNMFGSRVLTPGDFEQLYRDFSTDTPMGVCYVESSKYDRSSLLSYILERKFGLSSFTIGMYELPKFKKRGVVQSIHDCVDARVLGVFVSDTEHIRCVKWSATHGQWMHLDSLRAGPVPTTLQALEMDPRLTLVFPWTKARCKQGVAEMAHMVRCRFRHASKADIGRQIVVDLARREPSFFGYTQTWIALFYRYLALTTARNDHRAMAVRYREYESGRKLDTVHALRHLPDLVMFIVGHT